MTVAVTGLRDVSRDSVGGRGFFAGIIMVLPAGNEGVLDVCYDVESVLCTAVATSI